jgi:activator of HSP90 ATPase
VDDKLELSIILPATARQLYEAWLDSKAHSLFTGAGAEINPQVGGAFTAWDGYISGKTLALEPYRCITQSWRTTEFPENAPDSHLEILFEEVDQGARLTLHHTQIPAGQTAEYEQGWQDFYFKPMKEYFTK